MVGNVWFGVDMESEGVADNYEKFVWEPTLVKINMISSATEAACLILSVDETVKNPQAEQTQQTAMRGRGRGRGR
jgi:T-complex protein 1 subunit eta